jgi:MoxR-like ATPase
MAFDRELEGQNPPQTEDLGWAQDKLEQVVSNVSRVIMGKEEVIRTVLTAFCARGHVLLEDFPGVGKTLMAQAVAKSLDVEVNRVQFTPDVVPSDVTGSVVFRRQDDTFEFRRGPVFTNILLADEINRGTPRTQSSMLEAMEERAVTADGVRYELPVPFFVVATQNPLEMHGTFPLPESQLDRFMIQTSLGYPDLEAEDQMLQTYCGSYPLDDLEPVLSLDESMRLIALTKTVFLGEKARRYLLGLAREIRDDSRVHMGVSPRGALSLARAAQARALGEGRDSVLPDDVKSLALPVLAHRVIPNSHSDSSEALVREILERVPVPVS